MTFFARRKSVMDLSKVYNGRNQPWRSGQPHRQQGACTDGFLPWSRGKVCQQGMGQGADYFDICGLFGWCLLWTHTNTRRPRKTKAFQIRLVLGEILRLGRRLLPRIPISNSGRHHWRLKLLRSIHTNADWRRNAKIGEHIVCHIVHLHRIVAANVFVVCWAQRIFEYLDWNRAGVYRCTQRSEKFKIF